MVNLPHDTAAIPPEAVQGIRQANFYFWYFAFLGVFGTYFALYLRALGFSAAQMAFLLSLQQLVRIVAPHLWGWLADRLHRRIAIIRATLVMAVSLFPLSFTFASGAAMTILFGVMFFFWSAVLPLFEAGVMQASNGDSGRYARTRLWGSVGFIAAVLIAGWTLDRIDIRALLWMIEGLLLVSLLSSLVIPEQPPAPRRHGGESVWQVLKRPKAIALFAGCILMMASQGATMVFYSIYMVENGHSKTMLGVFFSLGVLAEIGIFLLLPQLNARFSAARLFAFSFAMTALRFLLIGWFPASTLLQMLAQLLHAFTFGMWHVAAMAMLHELFPPQLAARGQAMYTSLSNGVGGALGVLGAGMAWDALGPAWTYTLMSALVMLGWLVSWYGLVRRTKAVRIV